MKIGMIGVESKHAEFFGSLINGKKIIPGWQVTHIYPVDAPERLGYVQERVGQTKVCESAQELIDAVDAVLVITRLRDTHMDYARAAIEAGKPVFVDKPFLPDEAQARALLDFAREKGVPLAGGSTFCFLPEVEKWKALLADADCVTLRYWADPDSPFGGYSFYCSHMTDLATELFGRPERVYARRTGDLVTSLLEYDGRQVILQTAAQHGMLEASYSLNGAACVLRMNDLPCYECGMKVFRRAIEANSLMENADRLADSMAALNAILASLESGMPVRLN